MNKQEFLTLLRKKLAPLPPEEVEERLALYGEMIDDRMEEGLPEEDAVRTVGDVADIVKNTVVEVSLSNVRPEKKPLWPWGILVLILGAPLWLPLLMAAAGVVLSVYVTLWSVVISLWAVFVSVVASAVGFFFAAILLFLKGLPLPALALLGAVLITVGVVVSQSKTKAEVE